MKELECIWKETKKRKKKKSYFNDDGKELKNFLI